MKYKASTSTKILLITAFLTLIIYLDWSVTKGFLTSIIPIWLLYTLIIALGYFGYPELLTWVQNLRAYLSKILRNDKLLIKSFFILSMLLFLSKSTLNEYILNQNIFSLPEWSLITIVHLKYILKIFLSSTLLLFSTTIYLWSKKYLSINFTLQKKQNIKILILLIFLLFILIRLFFIFYYNGNFQDDWNHISAGMDFFDTWELNRINKYFLGHGYLRGSYTSVMVGLFFKLFGREVNIAQLVPFTISVLNFFLFYKVLIKSIKNKTVVALTLLIYSILPYVIVTHLYIRMYVFYEMFLLINILNTIKILQLIKEKKYSLTIFMIVILSVSNILFYYLSNDRGALLVPLLLSFSATYIYIIELGKSFIIKIKNTFLNSLFNISPKLKEIIVIVIFLLILIYISFFTEYLSYDTNSTTQIVNFKQLLFQEYSIFLLIGAISIPIIYKFENINTRMVYSTSLITILAINIIPSNLNLIRGLSILFPIILIFFAVGMQSIIALLSNHNYIRNTLIVILLIIVIRTYPPFFITQGPRIPGEVAYYEIEETLDYVHNNLKDSIHIYSSYNMVPNMYWGTNGEYILNIDNKLQGRYFPDDVKTISSIQEIKNLEQKNTVCIILRDYSEKLLLSQEVISYLDQEYSTKLKTIGFKIICSSN